MKGYQGIKQMIEQNKIQKRANKHNYNLKITEFGYYLIGYGKREGFQESFDFINDVVAYLEGVDANGF